MSHSKIVSALCAFTASALLAACGGGGGGGNSVLPKPTPAPSNAPSPVPSSTASPHPSASPSSTPTASPAPSPTPHNYFFDKSQGLPSGAQPYAIAADAQNVWFTDRGVHAIGSVAIAGGSAQEHYLSAGIDPLEIAPDHLGSLVFSEASGSSYGSFAPGPSQFSQVALPAINSPLTQRGIVADSSGRVYVAVGSTGDTAATQGVYTVNGVLRLGAHIIDPTSVVSDSSSGYVFVALHNSSAIEAIKTNGEIVAKINTADKPVSLADLNGVVYAVDGVSGSVLGVSAPYTQASVVTQASCAVAHIVAGVADDLWFTEPLCDKIGHYSVSTGAMTEFVNRAAPSGSPDHIAVDPIGRVWFTDSTTNKIFEYYP